jgi:hypothetical protein
MRVLAVFFSSSAAGARWPAGHKWESTNPPAGLLCFPLLGCHSAHCGRLFDLYNALDRADGDALRRVVMTFALNTGCLIDNVKNAIAFTD